MTAAIAALLVVAVVVLLLCCTSLLLLDNVLDRLHALGPAAMVSGMAVVVAVWLQHGLDTSSIKASLILIVLVLTGPVVSHTMAWATVERTRHASRQSE